MLKVAKDNWPFIFSLLFEVIKMPKCNFNLTDCPKNYRIEDDIQLLAWESTPYISPFSEVMKTFSKNEVWNLQTFAGQRVCFEGTLMLPLLPRMTKGLYYGTPLTDNGCSNSSLFTQFSAFITDRCDQ